MSNRCCRFALLAISLFAGCQQKMANQPSYKPLDGCDLFADGRSARPIPPGTIARGHLHTDLALCTGRRVALGGEQDSATGLVPADLKATIQPKESASSAAGKPIDDKVRYAAFVDAFPMTVDEEFVQHGRDRFMIYCVVCHDPLGTGLGKVVRRGYTQPPSYHIDRLRNAPVGYLYAVISEGYGAMPSYAAQISARDRWAIVAYLRALQASQHQPAPDQTSSGGKGP